LSNVVTRLALPTFLAFAAGCRSATSELVSIDGSPGVAPIVNALVAAYRQKHPERLVLVGAGIASSERLPALTQGRIDIAMASHGVDEDELRRRSMSAVTIARTPVVFAVNASVQIEGLSSQQLCDIFAGKVSSWRQLGGPDTEPKVGMRPPQEVDAEVALQGVKCLNGIRFGPRVQMVERPDDMARAIAGTAGAIGLTSGTLVQQSGGRMTALSLDGVAPTAENVAAARYPLTRSSILVYRNRPDRAVTQFLEFVRSPAGAQVIRANGAMPVATP
jgi:phosphate transport system substrate-binding protein